MKLSIFYSIALCLALFSCNTPTGQSYQASTIVANYSDKQPDGKVLMEQQCYVCHSPSASMEKRLAPPMIAVKKHYLDANTTKNEFVAAVWDWVEKPSEEKTKMRGAVRRFGVMPYQKFEEEDIKAIAAYIFENDIETPEWFEEHYKGRKGKSN